MGRLGDESIRDEEAFVARKYKHILREYEERWSQGHVRQERILRTRTWAVTMLAAYLTLTATFLDKLASDDSQGSNTTTATVARDANDVGGPGIALPSVHDSDAVILAFVGAIALFWIMEAFAGALGRLNMAFIRKVDNIFSEEEPARFRHAVKDYEFPNNPPRREKWWLVKGGKWDRFCHALL